MTIRWPIGMGVLALCGCFALVMGCGDDDSGTNNNTIPDATVDASTGESLTFIVHSSQGTDATPLPLPAAMVAFDPPGGVREELLTDAEGRVTFDNIDWSAGTATVTAFKLGYTMASGVNFDDADIAEGADAFIDGAIPIQLSPLEPEEPPFVQLSGTATGLDSLSHSYFVQAQGVPYSTRRTSTGQGTFWLDVTPDMPFTLIGVEGDFHTYPSNQGHYMNFYRAMSREFGPQSSDATGLELDFAAEEIPSHTMDASMFLPTRPDSPLRTGHPAFWVGDGISRFPIGWPESVDISADGNHFDLRSLWLEPSSVTDPVTLYEVRDEDGILASTAREPGYPQGGVLDPPLIDVPRWITPADPATAHPLHSAIQWELFDDVDNRHLAIRNNGQILWVVAIYDESTTVSIPQAPAVVNEAVFLDGTPNAQLIVGTNLDGLEGFYRQSRSARILLDTSQ